MMNDGTYLYLGYGEYTPLNPKRGYWVAYAELPTEYPDSRTIVGIWTDTDGKVYRDLTLWISDLYIALDFGRANKQKAIWDIANNCEIRLD